MFIEQIDHEYTCSDKQLIHFFQHHLYNQFIFNVVQQYYAKIVPERYYGDMDFLTNQHILR